MVTRFVTGDDGVGYTVERPGVHDFGQLLREQRRFRLEQLRDLETTESGATGSMLEVTNTLRHAAKSALAEVDAALARIQAGTYGRCVRCDESILSERLEIVPMAALCMRCQREDERAGG